MLNWMKRNKWKLLIGIVLTCLAVRYEYVRRGSLEYGSEYALLFIPFFMPKLNEVATFTKGISKELLDELKGVE